MLQWSMVVELIGRGACEIAGCGAPGRKLGSTTLKADNALGTKSYVDEAVVGL